MGSGKNKFLKIFLVNIVVSFIVFYLFEEEKACLTNFGSRCSNQFIIRCSVQALVLSVVFYFSFRKGTQNPNT